MAGKHHFCGKVMTVSQHNSRKRSKQLLQEFSNRHKKTNSRSRAQASSKISWGRGRKTWEKNRGKRKEHPDMLATVSLDSFRLTVTAFYHFFSLTTLAGAVICFFVPGCSWVQKVALQKDPLDSKSCKCHSSRVVFFYLQINGISFQDVSILWR